MFSLGSTDARTSAQYTSKFGHPSRHPQPLTSTLSDLCHVSITVAQQLSRPSRMLVGVIEGRHSRRRRTQRASATSTQSLYSE